MYDLAKIPEQQKVLCYAAEVIVPHTESHAWKYSRYDVVLDIYHQDSLKSEMQQKRGTRVCQNAGNIRPPKSRNNCLRCDESKS